ncbi:MAG TPA: Smr/MutS family protein, partial [Phenylobacterium sp.]|nr:Smr/MutS family protein [Phenylobacterium sp.]
MKRPIRPEELRLWSMVAATVHPMPGRAVPKAEARPAEAMPPQAIDPKAPAARIPPPATKARPAPQRGPAEAIEPRRKQRIARERDPIGAHIDLHGLGQDQARALLERFVLQSWHEGLRAVLVITGKGLRGDGVLKRMTPEWLAAAHLRHVVAGISESHRRHG